MIDETSEFEREDEFIHPNTTTVGTQTDLTAEDISKLEYEYQKKTDEVFGLHGTKGFGYPNPLGIQILRLTSYPLKSGAHALNYSSSTKSSTNHHVCLSIMTI